MTANPNIALSIGYVVSNGSNNINLINYYTNYTQGVCEIQGARYSFSDNKYYHDIPQDINRCLYKTEHGLMKNVGIYIDLDMLFNIGGIFTYPCIVEDNCDTGTCSTFALTSIFSGDIPIRGVNNTVPSTPTGLSITPGDGKLNIQWNSVSGDIAVYYVAIYFGGNLWTNGYTLDYRRNITISGLTNNSTYNVEVRAITYNNIQGAAATGNGIPKQQCLPLYITQSIV